MFESPRDNLLHAFKVVIGAGADFKLPIFTARRGAIDKYHHTAYGIRTRLMRNIIAFDAVRWFL